MGTAEFEDSRQQTFIVPITYPYTTAPYSISRAEKHSTCLACINLDGIFGKPQYAVQRSTFDTEIYNYLDPEEIQIVHTDSGYINTESFTFWLYTSFLPELHTLRERYNYSEKAILIMDNCSSHITAIQNLNVIQENLHIHIIVPHSSHLTQPLDLNVLGPTKQYMSNYHYVENISRQSNQIIKIHTSLKQSTTTFHYRAAFRSIGIHPIMKSIGNSVQLLASVNYSMITRIQEYTISYILRLIQSQAPLALIQSHIYSNYIREQHQKNLTNQNNRVQLPAFRKNCGQNQIPMPMIYLQKSNF